MTSESDHGNCRDRQEVRKPRPSRVQDSRTLTQKRLKEESEDAAERVDTTAAGEKTPSGSPQGEEHSSVVFKPRPFKNMFIAKKYK